MPQKKHKPDEIVAKLRRVEALVSQGQSVTEAVRSIGVTQFTYYRWRKEFGGLKTDQVWRLKELEKENEQLRKAVSDLTLEKLILREAASRIGRRLTRLWVPIWRLQEERNMPGPDPSALWFERHEGRITGELRALSLGAGNDGNRKTRAVATLKRLMRHDWRCRWCGDELPAWRRVDAQYCCESCRKRAARSRRKSWGAV